MCWILFNTTIFKSSKNILKLETVYNQIEGFIVVSRCIIENLQFTLQWPKVNFSDIDYY